MIDLHSHILPGIDDGAKDMATAVEMARIAEDDGIRVMACTPHITPGVYDNVCWGIEDAVAELREVLLAESVKLDLVIGADIHVSPNMGEQILAGTWPSLAGTKYFLFEPPHTILPPHLIQLAKNLLTCGLTPILTHPERLTWIESNYDIICGLKELGVLIQVTAGSITGDFGRRAKFWSDRMLEEGRVDLIASDAHSTTMRPPVLSRARDEVALKFGADVAFSLVEAHPEYVLRNEPVPNLFLFEQDRPKGSKSTSLWSWWQNLSGMKS